MIGYTLKHILTLVPEAYSFTKSASLTEEYPLSSKADVIASGLRVEYDLMVNKKSPDSVTLEKIAQAVEAFGVEHDLENLKKALHIKNEGIEKKASESFGETWLTKQANFLGELSFSKDIGVLVKEAEQIFEAAASEGKTPCEQVIVYSANGYLSKEAALKGIQARYYLTKNDTLLKIAAAMSSQKDFMEPSALSKNLCATITNMDKEAGLHSKGFDFFRETMFTKSAALAASSFTIQGRSYPVETLLRIPESYMTSYMGADFTKEAHADPMGAKYLVESLPMDMKNVLATLLKNV